MDSMLTVAELGEVVLQDDIVVPGENPVVASSGIVYFCEKTYRRFERTDYSCQNCTLGQSHESTCTVRHLEGYSHLCCCRNDNNVSFPETAVPLLCRHPDWS